VQFTLRDLLLLCVVLASALATFPIGFGMTFFFLILIIFGWRRSTLRKMKIIFLALILFWCLVYIFFYGLLPPSFEARDSINRMLCNLNLFRIGSALNEFQSVRQHLPPAHTADAQGKPLHSWRTMILPFLYHQSFYYQLDLKKPWNDLRNKQLQTVNISEYACSAASRKQDPHFTNYIAITGPHTLWPDDRPGDLDHIPDGSAQTILAIEIGQSDIAWGEPRDLTLKEMEERLNAYDPNGAFSPHQCRESGYFSDQVPAVNVLFADGHVAFCTKDLLQKYLQAMVTPDGGERINIKEVDGILVDQDEGSGPRPILILSRVYSRIIFIVSSLLLIFLPYRRQLKQATGESQEFGVPGTERGIPEVGQRN
jgi:prepilin-type processing-associated H-X9-DG protein